MNYIITGNHKGQAIAKTAHGNVQAFTIIEQLNLDGVTNIEMKSIGEETPKVSVLQNEKHDKKGLAKMRTFKGAIEDLKKEDPNTPINEYALRRFVKQGLVSAVFTGRKTLISMGSLYEFLASGAIDEPTVGKKEYGVIRKVKE